MRKRKTGSVYFVCFAALMLVAQLLITSGHVHDAGSQSERGHALAARLLGDRATLPVKSHSGHDGFCPLCWAQGVAGSVLIPPATALQHPVDIVQSQSIIPASRIEACSSPCAFNSRAPPASV